MSWKDKCSIRCLIFLIPFAIFFSPTEATDCWKNVTSDSTGSFQITPRNSNITCYNFTLTNVTGNIVFKMTPGSKGVTNLASISIYNINSTGGAFLVSSFTNDSSTLSPAEYLAIGFGNSTTLPVARIFVNISSPLASNVTYVIGTYSNASTACRLNTTLVNELTVPRYQFGLNTTFTCTVNYSQPSGEESVYSFTDFHFTSPSSQLNITSSSHNGTASFSGTDLPYDFSAAKNLILTMAINANTNDSFSASSTPGSFKMVTVNSSGTEIRSLGYLLGQYSNNLDSRVVLVSADPNKHLTVHVADMEMAHDADHLEVIDGGASRDSFAKSLAYYSALDGYKDRESVVSSSGSALMLRFITDDLDTAKGYKLLVNQTDVSGTYYTPSTIQVLANGSSNQSFEMVMVAPHEKLVKLAPSTFNSTAASIMCYDGRSNTSALVASYRPGLEVYPAFSSGTKMLCVARGLKDKEGFSALADEVTQATSKFSVSSTDSYSVSSVAASNLSYEWIIQPDAYYAEVIELTVGHLSFLDTKANVTVKIASLANTSYSKISQSTPLPYIVRVPRATGVRLSVRVAYNKEELINSVPPVLSFAATYTLKNSTQGLIDLTGVVTSPNYPNGIPALTNNTWLIVLPPKKALQFSFDPLFALCNGSSLTFTVKRNNSKPLAYTGPMKRAPGDLILNNTFPNQNFIVNISLVATSQCYQAGVKIGYTHLDTGYKSSLVGPSQLLHTPNYPAKLNLSYQASWLLSVPVNNSDGLLQSVSAKVAFKSAVGTALELRDGPRYDSPLIALNSSQGDAISTTGNYLYVSYQYDSSTTKLPGAPFSLTAFLQVCDSSSQCQLLSNKTVCMPASWKCDHIYQCRDGKDELGCFVPTTTPTPPVTKEVAKWWVVILCIIAGILLGGVLGVICVTVIMRRRGRGYSQLNDLLTPVST